MEELLIYVLKSAGLISLFFVVYYVLLRNDTSFQRNRCFLLTGILISAVLPAVELVRPVPVPGDFLTTQISSMDYGHDTVHRSAGTTWWEIAVGLYIIVTAFMLLRVMMQLLSLFRMIRKGRLTQDGRFKIIRLDQELPPFSFFQYIIFNPTMHADEDLRNILQHEKVHASQGHSFDVLLINLTCAVLWFNPMSWWYRKSMVQNLEYIADRQAVSVVPKSRYQKTMVRLALTNQQPALANNFYQSLIKKRILMLNKTSKNRASLWKMGAILPLLLVFMFFFNFKTVAQIASVHPNNSDVSIVISPDTTEETLEEFKKQIQKKGVQLSFDNLERNSEGLITGISASFSTSKGESGTISSYSSDGIKTFALVSDENGTSFIQSADSDERLSYQFNQGTSAEDINASDFGNDTDLSFVVQEENPIVVVNGKVMKKGYDLQSINPDDIASINVLKGDNAQKKYGKEAAKGGVVEIVTKEAAKSAGKTAANSKRVTVVTKGESHATLDIKGMSDNQNPNSQPLYVVDGKVKKADFDMSSVDVNTIESVYVLKGTSATTKYGQKGQDGVIEITTKQ